MFSELEERIMPNNNEHKKIQITVYIRGGVCIDVKTNLPDNTWEYDVIDYDNNAPELPDNHGPI